MVRLQQRKQQIPSELKRAEIEQVTDREAILFWKLHATKRARKHAHATMEKIATHIHFWTSFFNMWVDCVLLKDEGWGGFITMRFQIYVRGIIFKNKNFNLIISARKTYFKISQSYLLSIICRYMRLATAPASSLKSQVVESYQHLNYFATNHRLCQADIRSR